MYGAISDTSSSLECMFRHVLRHTRMSEHLFAFAFSRDNNTCVVFACDVTRLPECFETREDGGWDLYISKDSLSSYFGKAIE